MVELRAYVVTLSGTEYALFERDSEPRFPDGAFAKGESPRDACRRLLREWCGHDEAKLEVLDFVTAPGSVLFVFRALLTEPPRTPHKRVARMTLPSQVGALKAGEIEEMQKTGLNYKLTRR